MKNKPFIILIVLIALTLSAYFTRGDSIPKEDSVFVKETKLYEYDK